ncbi:MAG: ribonuclease HI family protein [Nanoarchaeota archaeon]|nr:ribonuclease HI family protein [Nanoarchaeota archaeon]
MKNCSIYSDGGCRGNPGLSAIGVVLVNESGRIIREYKKFLGFGTNNRAEYNALIKGLSMAADVGCKNIICYSDSELMIKQLTGEYKIHDKRLLELFVIVKKKESSFDSVKYSHVNRTNSFIKVADSLVNQALDEQE